MKQTYLIIGGAGFIGCNAAEYFLAKGHAVIVFDNFSRRGAEDNVAWLKTLNNKENLEVIVGDITDKNTTILAQAVERADYVIHLAAQVAVTTSVTNPGHDFFTNAWGTFNLLEVIRTSAKRPAIIYASTNKVYGGLEQVPTVENDERYSFVDRAGVSEDTPLDFHSPYGCSKGAADQYVRDYARMYGLKTAVCRQSCIYGPRQFGIEDQGWVAWFIIATVTGQPITIYGNGKQVRDLLYVGDLVQLYDVIFQNINSVTGTIFNIGGGPDNTLSLLEFLKILGEKKGQSIPYTTGGTRPGDQPIYVSDISYAQKVLGWVPAVNVQKGIDILWQWVQNNVDLFKSL